MMRWPPVPVGGNGADADARRAGEMHAGLGSGAGRLPGYDRILLFPPPVTVTSVLLDAQHA